MPSTLAKTPCLASAAVRAMGARCMFALHCFAFHFFALAAWPQVPYIKDREEARWMGNDRAMGDLNINPRHAGKENTMRVFVAGASGAIGRKLVPQLIDRGYKVVGT